MGGNAQLVINCLECRYLLSGDMSLLQFPGTQGQNMRLNRLSHIYIYIYIYTCIDTSKNTVLFVNATIGFSENLVLVLKYIARCLFCLTQP